jgi:hypothetical protein
LLKRFESKKICILLGFPIIIIGLFVAIHAPDVRGQQTGISTLFISLTNGEQGKSYTLYLKAKDAGNATKDQLSVTLDAPNTNLNYFPPLGVTINDGDFLCYDLINPGSCSQILPPDPFGTSTVTLPLR